MQGRKPNSRKKGIKILVYGDTGTGKTLFGLSFPKIKAIDSEDGYSWYEDDPVDGRNLLEIYDTQSFYDLKDVLEDLMEDEEVGTFIIDSETKIHEDIQQALLDIDEKRARQKGKNTLDANLSIRSYGKIKQLETRLQNAKIALASRGINVISVAQMKDVMEDVSETKRIKVGEVPDMKKKATYDYDVVIKLFKDDEDKYFGKIEKDRTKTTTLGQVIENPSYEIWQERLEGKKNQGDVVKKDFVGNNDESKRKYENELESEEEAALPPADQIKKFVISIKDKEDLKKEFVTEVAKISKKTLSKMSDEELAEVLKLIKNFKEDKGL
ncbi:AAA family ATPase [Liquorilactobacillus mali]|uniref:Uncharacterized protein n=1 Tax=Liquorilactobacillus mali KCTC 3596 = DSM 20444 TaxID=1046596 RepID=A0A0R2E575_9LACO|nr:AAA family ATPase [Liquorilactobacillus mali]KRN10774.1 hypothetical protein FD00_GL002016 [Liquorilactobacillus mali KCTC 3596 = DSM 20444]